jgi:hypothetical protein
VEHGGSSAGRGTYVLFPGGRIEDRGASWERYPLDPRGITGSLAENNGDTIAASVALLAGSGDRWRLTVRDISSAHRGR